MRWFLPVQPFETATLLRDAGPRTILSALAGKSLDGEICREVPRQRLSPPGSRHLYTAKDKRVKQRQHTMVVARERQGHEHLPSVPTAAGGKKPTAHGRATLYNTNAYKGVPGKCQNSRTYRGACHGTQNPQLECIPNQCSTLPASQLCHARGVLTACCPIGAVRFAHPAEPSYVLTRRQQLPRAVGTPAAVSWNMFIT